MLGIGVLQWNASQHTLSLLKDLKDAQCLIAVCDNGSSKMHVDAVLSYLNFVGQEVPLDRWAGGQGAITVILNRYNSGFSAGMNLCIATLLEQKVDWIWLLNNDTLLDSGSISNIRESIRELKPGVYGTAMQDMPSREIGYGNQFNLFTTKFKSIKNFTGDYKALGDWYPDGASLLIHREVLEKVGLLSENYFIYFEELDYKRRAMKYGYDLKLLPNVVVLHKQAGSSSQNSFAARKMYHETYSSLTFYQKHHTWYLPVLLLLRTPVRLLSLLYKLRFEELKPVMIATLDFLKGNRAEFYAPEVTDQQYFLYK